MAKRKPAAAAAAPEAAPAAAAPKADKHQGIMALMLGTKRVGRSEVALGEGYDSFDELAERIIRTWATERDPETDTAVLMLEPGVDFDMEGSLPDSFEKRIIRGLANDARRDQHHRLTRRHISLRVFPSGTKHHVPVVDGDGKPTGRTETVDYSNHIGIVVRAVPDGALDALGIDDAVGAAAAE